MVAKAVEEVTAPGVAREVEGSLEVAAKGVIFNAHSSAKVCSLVLTSLAFILAQPLVIAMKGLLFVGGFKGDKTLFAVVSDDRPNSRFCHVFRSNEQV